MIASLVSLLAIHGHQLDPECDIRQILYRNSTVLSRNSRGKLEKFGYRQKVVFLLAFKYKYRLNTVLHAWRGCCR